MFEEDQELRRKRYSFGWIEGEISRLGLGKTEAYPFKQTVYFYEFAREYFRYTFFSFFKHEEPYEFDQARNLAREIADELFPAKWVPRSRPEDPHSELPVKPELSSEEQMANTPFMKLPEEKRKKLFDDYSKKISQILSEILYDDTPYAIKNEAPFLRPIPFLRKPIDPNLVEKVAKKYEEKWQDIQKEVMEKPDPTKAWLMCKINLYKSDETIKNAIQDHLDKMRKLHKIDDPNEETRLKYLSNHLRQLGAFRLIQLKKYRTVKAAAEDNDTYFSEIKPWYPARKETKKRLKDLFGIEVK